MGSVDRDVARIAHRPEWSEGEARRIIAAWRRSGESIAEFARQCGVAAYRLYYWRTRVGAQRLERAEPSGVQAPPFHPVRVRARPAELAMLPRGDRAPAIVIHAVRIPPGTAPEDIHVVLAALGRGG